MRYSDHAQYTVPDIGRLRQELVHPDRLKSMSPFLRMGKPVPLVTQCPQTAHGTQYWKCHLGEPPSLPVPLIFLKFFVWPASRPAYLARQPSSQPPWQPGGQPGQPARQPASPPHSPIWSPRWCPIGVPTIFASVFNGGICIKIRGAPMGRCRNSLMGRTYGAHLWGAAQVSKTIKFHQSNYDEKIRIRTLRCSTR